MGKFKLRQIINANIEKELQQIGFDEGYRSVASNKFKYKNLKIYDLTPAQANILKQTAISCGADCATHRDVITGKIEHSDVILGGSEIELKKIAEKLKHQPFKLGELGEKIIENSTNQKRVTKLAGILNITPDSFSDGGLYMNPIDAQKHMVQMIADGADMIDIGAESTRPYSEEVSPKEQISRLRPILEFVQKENITIPLSADTRSSEVADFALNMGVNIINDVSGFDFDKNMANIIAKYKAGVIIQHSLGIPKTMQTEPKYNNLIEDIYMSLQNKAKYAESLGIENIIIDPGIGFGKTKEDNFEILNRCEEFFSMNYPVMIGISRKSMLQVTENNNEIKDILSVALSYPLAKKGVDYLRVHNVKLHKKMLNFIQKV